jgi:tetratricopeptide (TPR) repeat protein
LFDTLPVAWQHALCRLAVIEIPLPFQALIPITGWTSDALVEALTAYWHPWGWVEADGVPEDPHQTRWMVHPRLRAKLTALMTNIERQTAHQAAGVALRELARDWHPERLPGWTWIDALILARGHFQAAGQAEDAWAVDAIVNRFLQGHGCARAMERFNRRALTWMEHPWAMLGIAQALMLRHATGEARVWLDTALRASKGGHHPQVEAHVWRTLGTLALEEQDLETATEQLEQARALSHAQKDHAGTALAIKQLAVIALKQGAPETAKAHWEQALTLDRALDNPAGVAGTLFQLATLNLQEENNATALRQLGEVLVLNQRLGDTVAERVTRSVLGHTYLREESWPQAREHLEPALALARAAGDEEDEARLLHQLATLDMYAHQHAAALERLKASMAIKWRRKDFKGQAAGYFQLGRLAKEMGRPNEALRLVAICHRLDHELDHDDAHRSLEVCQDLVTELKLEERELDAILNEAWDAYRQDQGWAWLQRAFVTRQTIPIMPIR